MTVILCTFNDVIALDDAQRAADFTGGPEGEIDEDADESVLCALEAAAQEAVFGTTIGDLFAHHIEFVQRVVAPATIEETHQLAERAGFDLMRDGQPLLDWYNYGVLILASLEGKARSRDEIEQDFEEAIRRKLGAPKDDWLTQNNRPRRRGQRRPEG